MNRRLDEARLVGDPPADRIVERLAARGELGSVNATLRALARNGSPLPDGLPARLRRFLEHDAAVPPWAKRTRIQNAERFADRNAVPIATALFCASLPSAFAAAKGALVLAASGRMHADVDRRINETGSFVFDVLAPGGFDPDGRAIRSVQKVRLLHAAVRHHLRARSSVEVPINQEDLLGTLCCFSTVVLSACKRLGVAIADADADDYFHLWRVVGAMLGIEEALLPPDLREARELAGHIARRQVRSSPHGERLTRVLLAGLERHMPTASLRGTPRHLIEYLLGQTAAEALGLRSAPRATCPVSWPIRQLSRLMIEHGGGMGRQVLERVIGWKLGGATPAFAMPERLAPPPRAPRRHPAHSNLSVTGSPTPAPRR